MHGVSDLISKYVKSITLKSYLSLCLSSFVLCICLPFAKLRYDFKNRKVKK